MTLLEALTQTTLRWLAGALQPYWPPPQPFPPQATLLREDGSMLVYSLTLPPKSAPDVTTRELTKTVNGGAPEVVSTSATDGMELSFNDGDSVVLTLVDIDERGNRSQPSPEFSFTADDTIAPPAPGELGVTLIREDADEPAPPEGEEPAEPPV